MRIAVTLFSTSTGRLVWHSHTSTCNVSKCSACQCLCLPSVVVSVSHRQQQVDDGRILQRVSIYYCSTNVGANPRKVYTSSHVGASSLVSVLTRSVDTHMFCDNYRPRSDEFKLVADSAHGEPDNHIIRVDSEPCHMNVIGFETRGHHLAS